METPERRGVTEQGGTTGCSFCLEPGNAGLLSQEEGDRFVVAVVEGRQGFDGKKSD